MKYIVFDIDGVLADCSHRLHYIQGENKDYEKFYSSEEIMKDKPIPYIGAIMGAYDEFNGFCREGDEVYCIFVSGRNEKCRLATIKWLNEERHTYINEDELLLRPKNDYRPAHEVKEDLIKKHIGFENILFAFDDDDQVNEMYKKHGVMCYKPNITSAINKE